MPQRFNDFVVFPDTAIDGNTGDLMHAVLLAEAEPVTVEQALKEPHWKQAMIEELISIENNDTWQLVDLRVKKKKIDVKGKENKVYKLRKALYGLKQTPRAWNKRIDKFLLQQQFVKCTNEHGIYSKGSNTEDYLILCLYVDDMLLTGTNEAEMENFKKSMMLNLRCLTWVCLPIFWELSSLPLRRAFCCIRVNMLMMC